MKPNDSLFLKQWHHRLLSMEKVWEIGPGRKEIIVAVVESGFDIDHPDLRGGIIRCLNTAGPSSEMSDNSPKKGRARTDHGTHMLGLIGARADSRGVVGIAPGCSLMPVKVPSNTDDQEIARGIRAAANAGARVINLSNIAYWPLTKQGHPPLPRQAAPPLTRELYDACLYAREKGALICTIVATNQGFLEITWPAGYRPGLQVLQGDLRGRGPANFCSQSPLGDVFSPGGEREESGNADWPYRDKGGQQSGLLSTVSREGGFYRFWSGGCMAAAVASGVAALVFSRFPELSPEEARQVIRNSASRPWYEEYGGAGYINPLDALTLEKITAELVIRGAGEVAKAGGGKKRPEVPAKKGGGAPGEAAEKLPPCGETAAEDAARSPVSGAEAVPCTASGAVQNPGPTPGLRGEIEVENRGVLDSPPYLAAVYRGRPDRVECRQIWHGLFPPLRGFSSTTLSWQSPYGPAGDSREIWALLQQLPPRTGAGGAGFIPPIMQKIGQV